MQDYVYIPDICRTPSFTSMSFCARGMYPHLLFEANDEGIVDVEIVRRKTRSRRSAVRELIKNGLIVPLDDPCTKARICCWDQIKY